MENFAIEMDAKFVIERRRRIRVVLIAVPALAGSLLGLWTMGLNEDYFYRFGVRKELLLTLVVTFLGMSGLAVVMTYLQTGFKKSSEEEIELLVRQQEQEQEQEQERIQLAERTKNEDESVEIRMELHKIRAELEKAKHTIAPLDDAQRKEIMSEIRRQLIVDASCDTLVEVKAQIANAYAQETREKETLVRFDESRTRLSKELEALGRRGNLNLSLGAITTVVGLALLGLSVFSETISTKDLWSLVSHFVPRLTLVVMIELFAFFFLSLYKASLAEIKYFQNELTNIESKQLALRVAVSYGEQAMIGDIVVKLAETERNHVLSKDQTTVELEKARIDKDMKGDFVKFIGDMLQKKA